eukprot:9485280-Pyramimonas_sp.AAC.1
MGLWGVVCTLADTGTGSPLQNPKVRNFNIKDDAEARVRAVQEYNRELALAATRQMARAAFPQSDSPTKGA